MPRVAVRIAALVLGVAAVDLATKALAHAGQGGSRVNPVNNPGLALQLVDVSTGAEVMLGLVALLAMGGWAVRAGCLVGGVWSPPGFCWVVPLPT